MIKLHSIEALNATGLVRSFYTEKFEGNWKTFGKDPNRECFRYFSDLSFMLGIEPSDIVRVSQSHTDNIRIVTRDIAGEGVVRLEAPMDHDGMITNERGILLTTVQADCTPVYILDPNKRAIGMIHSGWKGTVKQIAVKAVRLMCENYGTDPSDLIVAMGPAICKECYEFGGELIDEFRMTFSEEEIEDLFEEKGNGKYLLDVSAGIRYSLVKTGVNYDNIYMPPYCTYHDSGFDSYRRDKDTVGRMLTGIMLL